MTFKVNLSRTSLADSNASCPEEKFVTSTRPELSLEDNGLNHPKPWCWPSFTKNRFHCLWYGSIIAYIT